MVLFRTATPIYFQDMGSSATHKDRDSQISHGVTDLFLRTNCHFREVHKFCFMGRMGVVRVSEATSWTSLWRCLSVQIVICAGAEWFDSKVKAVR